MTQKQYYVILKGRGTSILTWMLVIISTQFLTILHGHMTDESWRESKMCTTKEAK